MDLLLQRGKPIMLIGNAGVGKTILVSDKVAKLKEDYMVAKVPFNYYTTSAMLQRKKIVFFRAFKLANMSFKDEGFLGGFLVVSRVNWVFLAFVSTFLFCLAASLACNFSSLDLFSLAAVNKCQG